MEFSLRRTIQNERGSLLLFRKARASRVRRTRELDHRMGERHRASNPSMFHRLHLVSPSLRKLTGFPWFDVARV